MLQHELVGAGVDLADDDGVPGLDMGEECVQHAARALHVLTRPERLLEVREHPDDRTLGEAVDDLLHPRFEHPDERLARVDVGRAGLEREPVVAEPPERLDDQRRLADPRVADDEDRARPRRGQGADERVHGRDPAADERCRRPVVRIDETPELAEEVDVDRRRLPLLERGPERGPGRDVGSVDQLADERLQSGIELVELLERQELPRRNARLEEA